jgi:mannose-6-phosphate isomerase
MASNAAAMKRWLFETAMPLWRGVGIGSNGLAVEELDFAARPKDVGYHRVMVQFRQAFCFAKAALAERCDASVSRDLFTCAATAAKHPDGGWVRKLDFSGGVQDATREVCDQAFGLLAAAWTYRASGDAGVLAAAQHAFNFVDDRFAGGYTEAVPPRLPRRQNTHMHLLEAFLALYEATGDRAYLTRADAILLLLKTKFIDPNGFLLEYFDADLMPLEGPRNWMEPGHHFEWVWLLHEYARLSGAPLDPAAHRLFDVAVQYGLDAEGFAVAKIGTGREVVDRKKMLWAQTEMLKAHLAHGERIDPILANIARFLLPAGIWYEALDKIGAPLRNRMPASTFYHLTGAFTELSRKRAV